MTVEDIWRVLSHGNFSALLTLPPTEFLAVVVLILLVIAGVLWLGSLLILAIVSSYK